MAILFLSFQVGHHHAQKIDRQSALQTAEKENTDRIPFTLTLTSQPRIKSITLSFKRDINTGNFMFRSSFQTNDQPGTFRCTRSRCKTCPFIHNVEKMSEPKRSIKITDHFTCTSANVISCINCTYRKNLYIGETGRRLGDRFRKYLRDVERNDKDASKPVARHFILPNHSKQHMAACGLSLRRSESRKTQEKNLSSKSALLIPTVSTSAFHSTNLFLYSRHRIPTNSVAQFSACKPTDNPQFLQSL